MTSCKAAMVRWVAAALVLTGGSRVGQAADQLDWSAWRAIPVLHNGRLMPLDTFARDAVEIITNRSNPKLGLRGEVPDDELGSPEFAAARELFPGDQPRKFDAAELLFSWITEPERWEHVPFLYVTLDELRDKYLHVPITDAQGEHLKYVSPYVVQNAADFHDRLAELSSLQKQAAARQEDFELASFDAKLSSLQQAYSLYRQITFHPATVQTLAAIQETHTNSRFLHQLEDALTQWQRLEEGMQKFGVGSEKLPWADATAKMSAAAKELAARAQSAAVPRSEIEPHVGQFLEGARSTADYFAAARERLSKSSGELDQERLSALKPILRQIALDTEELAKTAKEMQLALYDNGDALRVVPALNAGALERNREASDDAQPWLNLQTLLFGSDAVLGGYPTADVAQVREAFATAAKSYQAWRREPNPRDAEQFATAMQTLAASLRSIGEAIEPVRKKLAIKDVDEGLMAYTAYPPAGSTATEVLFNRLQPFKWSWMINVASLLCFALSFGVLRKPMFWGGVLLLAAGLAWNIYGFGLRVSITRWAPVTNMYETLIYVAAFVSLLGTWFTLLPVTWPGISAGWRLTAVPGTWESTELGKEQRGLLSDATWRAAGYALLVPRAALMWLVFWALAQADYAAGGRHIINLLPNRAAGQSMPDVNSVLTWLVGLSVLVPAVWYLPRVILTLVSGVVLVPLGLRSGGRQLVEQVYPRWPFAFSAALVAFVGAYIAWWLPVPGKNIGPLQPVLRDNFWLLIHVLTIVSSYGAGLLAWGLGNIALAYYLFGSYRDPRAEQSSVGDSLPAAARQAAQTEADDELADNHRRRPPEQCATLAGYVYKGVQVAVLLLIAGTILGGLWADVSWGRFWGWDPKEVWALISGLVYLAILHGRYAGWFGNFGLCVGSVLGATAIIMSWYGVNFVLGVGLHSYGFGSGGQWEVASAVAVNWLFVAAAAMRYHWESNQRGLARPVADAVASING